MTVATIPASDIVTVTPGVLAPGGTGLDLIALALTNSTQPPIGSVQSFPSQAAVAAYFGSGSAEAAWASIYFAGFNNSRIKPGSLLFAQYPNAAVPAYLRGGNVSGLSLTELQAISGTLSILINGVAHTGSPNMSAATSFSDAASIIQAALTPVGDAAFTGVISGTQLTASSVTGALAIGQIVVGTGVTVGTKITALGTGTGGAGTYTVSPTQSASSTAMTSGGTLVTYDSTSGAFVVTGGTPGATATIAFATGSIANALKLSSTTGAVTSQGAAIATPAAFMNGILTQSTAWATFSTLFEPVTADGVAFAGWTSAQNNRYAYVAWDTDPNAILSGQTGTLGYLVQQADDSGTFLLYEPTDLLQAPFVCSIPASTDFTARNGRVNPTYKSQSGIVPGVTDQATAAQLRLNGYNFYGAWGTATQQFQGISPGSITGPFNWMDAYINQIWLNTSLQSAIMNLLFNVPSLPYNATGYNLIKAACSDPIHAALFNGVIQPGVALSALQIAEMNAAAGLPIDGAVYQQGWYLQVLSASAEVRAARGSPPVTLWWTDGGSIQKISLFSEDVQ